MDQAVDFVITMGSIYGNGVFNLLSVMQLNWNSAARFDPGDVTITLIALARSCGSRNHSDNLNLAPDALKEIEEVKMP